MTILESPNNQPFSSSPQILNPNLIPTPNLISRSMSKQVGDDSDETLQVVPDMKSISLKNLPKKTSRKSGPLVLDDMKIRYYVSNRKDFETEMVLSIVRTATWLQKNVLDKYPERGYFLRKKLSEGIEFTEEMNTYLISSYRHWTNELKISEENQTIDLSVDVKIRHCTSPDCNKCSNFNKSLQALLERFEEPTTEGIRSS